MLPLLSLLCDCSALRPQAVTNELEKHSAYRWVVSLFAVTYGHSSKVLSVSAPFPSENRKKANRALWSSTLTNSSSRTQSKHHREGVHGLPASPIAGHNCYRDLDSHSALASTPVSPSYGS